MRIRLSVVVIGVLLVSVSARAQDVDRASQPASAPREGCALHPSPECRYFGVTEFGLAFGLGKRETSNYFDDRGPKGEVNAEGGAMRNLAGKNAIGAAWFFKVGGGDISTGPAARYRRWLTRRQSLDVGLAVAAASSDYKPGALFGLLRYNPTPWVGLSVRPERIRRDTFVCEPGRCFAAVDDQLQIVAGADVTGKPGAVGLTVYGIAAGVLIGVAAIAFHGH